MECRLRQKKDKIIELCKFIKESKQKWTFWGAGVKNSIIIHIMEELDNNVSYRIIDNDIKKHGMIVGKTLVSGADVSLSNTDIVIVSNKTYLLSIYKQVKEYNNNIKIFLWYQFEDGIPLEKCFI